MSVIAVMDAGSVLGRDLLDVIETAQDAEWCRDVRIFGDTGGFVHFRGQDVQITPWTAEAFAGVDIALLGSEREVDAGAVVIRPGDDAPVVLADLDRDAVDEHRGTVCVPDGPSGALLRALGALSEVTRVDAVVIHPASVRGPEAIEELYGQHRALFNREPLPQQAIGDRLAYNILPSDTSLVGLSDAPCPIVATHLMAPLFGGTLLLATLETDVLPARAVEALEGQSGIDVRDEVQPADVVGHADVHVAVSPTGDGRIRLTIAVDEVRSVAASVLAAARAVIDLDAF